MALRTSQLFNGFLTQCFMSGLRRDIKNEVLAQWPTDMKEVITLAYFHQSRLGEQRKSLGRGLGSKLSPLLATPILKTNNNPKEMSGRTPPLESSPPPTNTIHPKKITAAEAQSRQEKGLCYYYNDKFTLGHKCKSPQLFLLDDGDGAEQNREGKTQNLRTGEWRSVRSHWCRLML
ncbi:hypothetical protein HRI_003760500 [Hibiscus trionum]|uniref:Uncharacterized protein n=1 Tax=Hibiscus trionum TaxID=183268 RepID=A0A9W7ITX7_HIBTR|nr:hypothetical protein HRI_003760500 [Hibiscus trionum]